jgi:O-antigen/teichoic acid export membrane protein
MFRDTAWASAGYGLALAIQGLYFVLLARALGPQGLGAFATGLAIAMILAPFAGLGSGNILVRETTRHRPAFSTCFGTALTTIAVTAPALLGVAWIGAELVGLGELSLILLLVGVAELVFARVVDLCTQCFQGHDDVRNAARISMVLSATRLGAVIGFIGLALPRTASAWSVVYLLASVVAAIAVLAITLGAYGRPSFRAGNLRRTMAHGFYFSLGSASRNVYGDVDKVLLTRIESTGISGVYNAAYRLVNFAAVPIQAFAFSAAARFFRAGMTGDDAVWRSARPTLIPVLGYGVLAGACLFTISPIVPRLLGDAYSESADVLRWLAIVPAIQSVHTVFGAALMGSDRQRARSLVQFGVAIGSVAVGAVLISYWSWRGAVVATVLSESVLAVILAGLLIAAARRDRRMAAADRHA